MKTASMCLLTQGAIHEPSGAALPDCAVPRVISFDKNYKDMNSTNLKELGFTDGVLLCKLNAADVPYQGGLFALIDKTLEGTTDIIYIGRAKNLVKRIYGDILGGQGKKGTRKIHDKLFNEGYLTKLEISWMPTDKLRARRADLLQKFKQEHGDNPSWNVRP